MLQPGQADAGESALSEWVLRNCTLDTDLDAELPLVSVVSQDTSRVFVHLFNNAFYAVSEQAISKVKARETYQPIVRVSTRQEKGCVEILIRDNGMGMPEAVQQKIFQPFFTTKPPGKGAGLGLSLAYDIVVKGHHGHLIMSSLEGEGTKFIITIPA